MANIFEEMNRAPETGDNDRRAIVDESNEYGPEEQAAAFEKAQAVAVQTITAQEN
jgi:hypothetical protein